MARASLYAALGAFLLAGCVSKPAPAPPPAPAVAPPALPTVITISEMPFDWRDVPLTDGEWLYGSGSSLARFGAATGAAAFLLRCDPAARRIELVREGGDPAVAMTIRTTSVERVFPASSAALPASDPFLDAIAFSRGRFTIEAAGLPTLVVPAWPEPAKVVEDCRN